MHASLVGGLFLLLASVPAGASAQTGGAPGGARGATAPETTPPPASTSAAPEGRVPVRQRAPSRGGLLGLDEVLSADPGPQGTYRLRLSVFHSTADDFPEGRAENRFTGGSLALAATPLPFLEAFLGLRNTSNANAGSYPEVLQTQGDLDLGLKGGHFVTDVIAVGGAASVHVTSGVGGSPVGDATASLHLRGLLTFDMHKVEQAPIRAHVNVGYFLENSDDVSESHPDELDLVQEFGLQVATYDRVTFGVGIETPVVPEVAPFVEYRLDVPLRVKVIRGAIDARDYTFGAFPHALTPGVRAFPLPQLAVEAAVRIGLSSDAYPGVPATPPWMVIAGLSYTLDPRPEVVDRPVAPPPPPDGRIRGRLVDSATGEPLRGARVEYLLGGHNPQVVDDAGRFTSYRLSPGKVALRLVAEGYASRTVEFTVEGGRDAPLETKLEPAPTQKGRLQVKLQDERGRARAGKVTIAGKPPRSGESAKDRAYEVELPVGRHAVTVDAEGYTAGEQQAEVKAGETTTLTVTLQRVAAKGEAAPKDDDAPAAGPLATIAGDRIKPRAAIRFEGETARLTAEAKRALDGVARLLEAHPEITKVRIEVHTAGGGEPASAIRLSEEQAASVQSHLVARGVAPGRLETKGRGAEQPVAPNLTERGREKNRRVDLVIGERR